MNTATHSKPGLSLLALVIIFGSSACATDPQPETPPGFVIHPDFQMELMAGEPLIYDPVALQFDENGRAFVLEMPGYPLEKEQSRLILLEDRDGDGLYDHRQVYADSLHLASSFMPYRGGMLVAAPPELLFIRDTDGDQVADDVEVIMKGFSAGNLQHNYNGLTYGLNNWIYAANGGNSGHPYYAQDSTIRLDMRDDDFRFRIEDRQLERVGQSSGGFGLAFDAWGHMYETHNLEHVSHLVFENRYLAELPVSPRHALTIISDHEENGLSRIYPIGEQDSRVNHPEQSGYFSGSCGITFYGGGTFPEPFNNNIFVADVVLNVVHLDVLEEDAAAFKTSRMREKVEFLASRDRAFRPVNMTVGPDGALYLIDIHREVIEHPEWIPDELEVNMDLNAGKDKGRIYRISPKGATMPVTKLDPQDPSSLVKAFESPNQWVRMTAQRLLVTATAQPPVAELEALYHQSKNPLARLHALWTLSGVKQLKPEILQKALSDTAPGVRENALKIAELQPGETPGLIPAMIAALMDDHQRVSMQAALCLSTLDQQAYMGYAADMLAAFDQLLKKDRSFDRWAILAYAAALQRQSGDFCSQLIAGGETLNEASAAVAVILAKVLGREKNGPAIAGILPQLAANTSFDAASRAAWIDAFAAGWEMDRKAYQDAALTAALEQLEATGEIPVIRAAGKLRQAMGMPASRRIGAVLATAATEVTKGELPVASRVELLQLIKLDAFDHREALLYQLLDNRQPLVIQKEALRQLWESNQSGVGPKLVALWPGLGPEARKGAGDILLYRPYHHDLLLGALEDGRIRLGELNFDLERRRELLFSDNADVRRRAETLFSDAGVVTRREAIEKMRPALQLTGDMAKGREIFTNLCSTCHQYGSLGENVGPVLTEIQRKSREALLHDILDPNAAVDTRYLNHRVSTTDGKVITGIVDQETDLEVSLRQMGGQQVTISKKDISDFTSLGISLMPEGLENGLSTQDLADLLAFLQQEIKAAAL